MILLLNHTFDTQFRLANKMKEGKIIHSIVNKEPFLAHFDIYLLYFFAPLVVVFILSAKAQLLKV